MPTNVLSSKQTRAFKIGARARKFALEDCVIEGYELLYTAVAESQSADPELHALLLVELDKFEKRMERLTLESEVQESIETGTTDS